MFYLFFKERRLSQNIKIVVNLMNKREEKCNLLGKLRWKAIYIFNNDVDNRVSLNIISLRNLPFSKGVS